MTGRQLDPPALDELEVSLFGPGYGEAIAVHLGSGKWALVDSCLHPRSGVPASLDYLDSLGINIENAVALVVATHWHDDHVRGISTVFARCHSATLAISDALRADEILELITLYREPAMITASGVDEFGQVFGILESRRQADAAINPPRLAGADTVLYRDKLFLADGEILTTVYALSPSDASKLQARIALGGMFPLAGRPKKRISSPSPNHAAVALWIEIGAHRILLGADLENTPDPLTGWSVILTSSQVTSGDAFFFKIPHHGSPTAHDDAVWSELLSQNPFAVLTPFTRGSNPLPSPRDVERIRRLTPHAYATARTAKVRHRWQTRVVRDLVEAATKDIRNLHYGWGHIRVRRNISDQEATPQVELFGDAYRLGS